MLQNINQVNARGSHCRDIKDPVFKVSWEGGQKFLSLHPSVLPGRGEKEVGPTFFVCSFSPLLSPASVFFSSGVFQGIDNLL